MVVADFLDERDSLFTKNIMIAGDLSIYTIRQWKYVLFSTSLLTSSKSWSVSPQNPAMKSDVNVTSGMADRILRTKSK
jgi:hypothetical protein